MYECEGDSFTHTGDNLNVLRFGNSACGSISAESSKIAQSLTSSKLNRDFFDNHQTSTTILELLGVCIETLHSKIAKSYC